MLWKGADLAKILCSRPRRIHLHNDRRFGTHLQAVVPAPGPTPAELAALLGSQPASLPVRACTLATDSQASALNVHLCISLHLSASPSIRTVPNDIAARPLNRGVLDGDLLYHSFEALSLDKQHEITVQIGTTVEAVTDDLEELRALW